MGLSQAPQPVALIGGVAVGGVDVPGAKLRALLVSLLLAGGRPVAAGALIDAVWDGDAPAEPLGALQALVSRVRRTTGLDVELVPGGYRVPAGAVDLDIAALDRAHRDAAAALAAGRPSEAGALARDALAGWQEPGGHLPSREAARINQVRRDLLVARAEAALAGDGPASERGEAIAVLDGAWAASRLDEPLAAALVRLLVADGRPTQALARYEAVRQALDGYGGQPCAALRAAHGEALAASAGDSPPVTQLPTLPQALAGGRVPEPLLGRAEDLAALTSRVDDHVLVTLAGPGGVGKTSLVAALTEIWRERGEPVHDVLLAGVRADADVVALVSAALRGPRRDGPSEPIPPLARGASLGQVAATARGLLVLDNAEHLLDAVADVALAVCAAAPRDLRVVVTSRAPLGVLGEQVQVLGPLADADAQALVRRRASAVRPGAALDAEALAELCRRLDNLPLALELAAARLRTMPLPDLLAGLDDRFALLATGPRGLPERHRSLQALIDWSWDLLAEPEQVLLRRLAVFPAGATGAMVAAVCTDDLLGERALASALADLVDASLVVFGAGRYLLLETVREYAEARSVASEREATSTRLAVWAAHRARDLAPHLHATGQRWAIAEVTAEREAFAVSLRWAAAAGRADLATAVALALADVATLLGAHREAVEWVRLVDAVPGALPPMRRVAAAPAAGDARQWQEGAVLAVYGVLSTLVLSDDRLLVRLVARLKRALDHRELLAEGEVLAIELVALLVRDAHDATLAAADRLAASSSPRWAIWGLLAAAWLRESAGLEDLGLSQAKDAHALASATGDAAGRSIAASFIGQRLAGAGELDAAGAWWAQAEEAATSIGAEADARQVRLLRLRTQLQTAREDDGAAERLCATLADLAAAHPEDDAVRFALIMARAAQALTAGDFPAARAIFAAAALELEGSMWAVPQAQALVLAGAAVVEARAGDPAAALVLLELAVTRARAARDVPVEAMVGDAVALRCALTGADGSARRLWAISERFGSHLHSSLGILVPPELAAAVAAGGAGEPPTTAEAAEVAALEAAAAVGLLRDLVDQALRR